jgi:hypothetical protein
MATQYWFKITKVEASHLLTLLEENERVGWYYGPKEQYFNRANRIKSKLLKMIKN